MNVYPSKQHAQGAHKKTSPRPPPHCAQRGARGRDEGERALHFTCQTISSKQQQKTEPTFPACQNRAAPATAPTSARSRRRLQATSRATVLSSRGATRWNNVAKAYQDFAAIAFLVASANTALSSRKRQKAQMVQNTPPVSTSQLAFLRAAARARRCRAAEPLTASPP